MLKTTISLPPPTADCLLEEEEELETQRKDLYQRAMKLETHTKLLQEMETWDNEFNRDGLEIIS
jgi:hypothetical protein